MTRSAALSRSEPLSRLLFYSLLFFYFIFSSGELLHLVIGIYKPKVGHIAALLLSAWMIVNRKAWKLERSLLQAFFFILVSLVLSALFGAAPSRSLGYVGVYLFNFFCYFFIPLQIIQVADIDRFFRIYWSSFVVIGLYAALQVFLSLFGIYEAMALQRVGTIARGQAWTYEPSYYALYMTPYVMYQNGKALLRKEREPLTEKLNLFCQNMLLVISTSTGILFSYPIFFITIVLKFINPFQTVVRRKIKKALLAFMVVLGTFSVLFYEVALHSIFKFFYFGFTNHQSFLARWEGIVASVQTFLKHPLLGMGLGGVSVDRFKEQSVYDAKIETLQEFEAFDPTNCFTEILASLGIVGLVAFIYLGVVFYRAYRRVLEDRAIDEASKKMAAALFISLVVMLIALQMNQGLFRPYVWIHAAVVYGYFQRLLFKVRA